MPLTDLAIRAAKPRSKAFKLFDGGGLYLHIKPGGSKLWRLKYRYGGREKLLSIGPYPLVSLSDARIKRELTKKELFDGVDPGAKKQLEKLEAEAAARQTFGLVAAEYIKRMEDDGAAAATLSKTRWLLEKLAAPLATRPVADVTPAEILDLLKRVEKSGRRETARRLRGVIGSVFRYAIVTLQAEKDPTIPLRGALASPKVMRRAAITDERSLGHCSSQLMSMTAGHHSQQH